MEGDLEKMWAAIAKPAQYSDSALSDFFDVQYTALSHFEEKPEDFAADAVMLRRRFTQEGEHDDQINESPGTRVCYVEFVMCKRHVPMHSIAIQRHKVQAMGLSKTAGYRMLDGLNLLRSIWRPLLDFASLIYSLPLPWWVAAVHHGMPRCPSPSLAMHPCRKHASSRP
eukprot:350048-Chlamydomonas_euryale.AAC.8